MYVNPWLVRERLWVETILGHVARPIARACSVSAQRPPVVEPMELTRFHTDDYVDFLRCISPDNMHEFLFDLRRCT